jgi:hypothetical protein
MKVVVEFDLPEGQAIPDPRDIVRLTSPDWISDWWHIDDVRSIDPQADYYGKDDGRESDLTDEECQEVLRLTNKYRDCEIGINWGVLESYIDHVKSQRKEVA